MLVLVVVKQILVSFLLLLVGAFCYKKEILTAANGKALSEFLLTFVSPAVILDSCQITFSPELFHNLQIAFLLSLLSFFISIGASYLVIPGKRTDCAIERFGLVYTNCGFIGLPLVSAIYGPEGVLYMAAYIAVFNGMLWTHGVLCMSGRMDRSQLLAIAKNPTIYAILLGIISFCGQITYPQVMGDTLHHLANLNTPLAMVVAGLSVMQTDLLTAFSNKKIYVFSLLKLLLLPVLTVFLLRFIPGQDLVLMTITIAAACPVGATGIMFALRYGKNEKYGSEIFAVTTILSLITLPLLVSFCNIF